MNMLIAYLLGLCTALLPKKTTNPKSENQDAYKHGEKGERRTFRAELATPIAIAVKNEPQERHPIWQRLKTGAEVFGIGAAVFIALITYFQWDDAHKNFILGQRAWLGVREPSSITNIVNGPEDSKITYVVTLRNYGNSVAKHIWITSKVATRADDIWPYITQSCGEADRGTNATLKVWNVERTAIAGGFLAGDVMFPSQEYGRWFKDISVKRTGVMFIVGCVAYRDQFGNLRHTKFCDWVQADLMQLKTGDLPVYLYAFFGANDAD
ncbi:MAG: hypothetical protein ABSG34_12990 [Candidatus Sulfotelmatobacter sp.]|jgi:hypothetical protein